MTRVITYGTFDFFHVGHVRLLKRLADLGDELYVCVSSDEFNAVKGKKSAMPYEERAEIVGACRYVDRVFPEHDWAQKEQDIVKHNIDIFAMGDDWAGKFDHLSSLCKVVYLSRTEGVSSTQIREYQKALFREELETISHYAQKIVDHIQT